MENTLPTVVRQLRELRIPEPPLLLEAKWRVSVVAAGDLRSCASAVRDVALIKFGLAIAKEVRSLLPLALKEAKEFVRNAPKPVKCGLGRPEAAALKA
ncbi:50S ribosomal subunit L7/L12 [Candidatus Hodgkinia cicadicola]|uniref:Vegetative protein 341 n=1 Tax=Candidatus Hodgkinia cicadicola TaxID=573658 RepID=A0A097GZW6_9HYPH|nr:Vegetative protein 341 [Candidatus Hodgkinia cicadicola]AUG34009.1 50S ribosomal subunit L7/L12 [Candidatus Hodgkinia cicadicola]